MTALTSATAGLRRSGWTRMIWVTWRQHRAGMFWALAFLAGMSTLLALDASALRAQWTSLGLNHCFPITQKGGSCDANLSQFFNTPPVNAAWQVMDGVHLVPVLIGIFVGAPLLTREFESGTYSFAWTQGIGRTRWVAAKLVFLAIPLTAAAALLGAAFSRWFGLFEWENTGSNGGNRWGGQAFDLAGITLAGWTLFAFTAGVYAGVLIKRTVPAMAATLGGVAVLAVLVPLLLRPWLLHLMPITGHYPVMAGYSPGASAVVFDTWLTGPDGHRITVNDFFQQTANVPADQIDTWLTAHHYASWATYQPASRFWIFQSLEAALLVGLALLFATATIRRVQRYAA
jgi:hypothetical protein